MPILSASQRTFCEEYVKNGNNGMQAYLNAYKSCKKENTARTNASRLLTKANIIEYIKELQAELKEKAIMSAEERMKWLTKVVNGEIKEKVAVQHENRETGEIKMIETDFPTKLDTKLKSLEILNKMTGEYTEKLELSNNKEKPFEVKITVVK